MKEVIAYITTWKKANQILKGEWNDKVVLLYKASGKKLVSIIHKGIKKEVHQLVKLLDEKNPVYKSDTYFSVLLFRPKNLYEKLDQEEIRTIPKIPSENYEYIDRIDFHLKKSDFYFLALYSDQQMIKFDMKTK